MHDPLMIWSRTDDMILDFGSKKILKSLYGMEPLIEGRNQLTGAPLGRQTTVLHEPRAVPPGTWRSRERRYRAGTFGIWPFATIAMHSYCECLLQCTVFVNVYRKTCPLFSPGFQEVGKRRRWLPGLWAGTRQSSEHRGSARYSEWLVTGRVEKGWGVKVSGLEGWRVSGFDGSRVVGFEFWSCFLWSCGAAELYIPKKFRKPFV